MANEKPITRRELDTIIEVNKSAIEIHNEVSEQNEQIMEELEKAKGADERILGELRELKSLRESNYELLSQLKDMKKDFEELHKNQFRTQVLLASGVISAIAQIVTLLKHG